MSVFFVNFILFKLALSCSNFIAILFYWSSKLIVMF